MLTDDPSETVKRPRVQPAQPQALATPQHALGDWRTWREALARRPLLTATLGSLAIYLVVALAYFWWPIHGQFGSTELCSGVPDCGQNLWYLKWWPYALSHGLNPFITYAMWHSYGYNLSWQTSMPGLSLLALPLTMTVGVVAAYNVLTILCFALTAWTTFILCHHLTRQFWASLIGGYLFGFSGYMLAQATGHIHLIALFPLPLAVYLAVLRYEGRISRVRYLALAPLPLLLLFLVSVEEFTLIAIFAYLTLAVYFLFAADERRQTLRLAIETTVAFVISGVVLTPYLYYMAIGYTKGAVHAVWIYASDLFGFVIPTRTFLPFSGSFASISLAGGNMVEQDSYLGLPLAALLVVFAIVYWKRPIGKTLTIMALISVAFSLGPYLYILGAQIIRSPMWLAFKLPLIQKSLPIRYAMFLDLFAAVMAALWLAFNVKRQWAKIALGLALIALLIPNLRQGIFFTPVRVPAFFSAGIYQRYLKPGDNLLILPLGYTRSDLLWQQAADYQFNLTSGYGGVTPHPEDLLPTNTLFTTYEGALTIPQPKTLADLNTYDYYLAHYLAVEHVNGVVVDERYFTQISPYLQFLHEQPLHTGGVWFYPVSAAFSQATLPAEQVIGERISRPYSLDGSARWDAVAQRLVVPGNTTGEALATLPDSTFAAGDYRISITIESGTVNPVADAEIILNNQTSQLTFVTLANGTTTTTVHVPGTTGSILTGKTGSLQVRIISNGGPAFSVGAMTVTRV